MIAIPPSKQKSSLRMKRTSLRRLSKPTGQYQPWFTIGWLSDNDRMAILCRTSHRQPCVECQQRLFTQGEFCFQHIPKVLSQILSTELLVFHSAHDSLLHVWSWKYQFLTIMELYRRTGRFSSPPHTLFIKIPVQPPTSTQIDIDNNLTNYKFNDVQNQTSQYY